MSARSSRHDLAVDGHSGVVQLRAAVVRGDRAGRRAGPRDDGVTATIRSLRVIGIGVAADALIHAGDRTRRPNRETAASIRRGVARSRRSGRPAYGSCTTVADHAPLCAFPISRAGATAHGAKFPDAVEAACAACGLHYRPGSRLDELGPASSSASALASGTTLPLWTSATLTAAGTWAIAVPPLSSLRRIRSRRTEPGRSAEGALRAVSAAVTLAAAPTTIAVEFAAAATWTRELRHLPFR